MSDLRVDETGPGALRLRLDAPAVRNALTWDTVSHLHELFEQRPTQTVLLGSASPDVFSSGADLSAPDADRAALSDLLYACYEHIVTRPGVVVAVVEGPAVGGGAQLTAAADLRVVSASARWRWVGPGHGLAVGAWILPDLVGRARALDLALTSRWLDAEEAVACGLAARVDAEPWQRAYDLAAALATQDVAALTRVKQIATRPTLLERLTEERETNRASWSGQALSPQEASAESRRLAPRADGSKHES